MRACCRRRGDASPTIFAPGTSKKCLFPGDIFDESLLLARHSGRRVPASPAPGPNKKCLFPGGNFDESLLPATRGRVAHYSPPLFFPTIFPTILPQLKIAAWLRPDGYIFMIGGVLS